ncbi:hypothetical protein N7468_008444 [Penicillium chermesinum]|uniref:Aminoglycoside phosphotransferase n=1 Tax=Penicillium chermesinum TaxID=63820 RepID=A0A9W9NPQ8_9EURO|nr:uncharacterized protein N7468_008444 [Penicillium chermesinum]KAJ5223902.1 hypothetical protein N7468_008444 [Penicillium chermesinum]
MGYIDHERSMSDLLETPGRQLKQRPELNPDISAIKLTLLYRQLANIVSSLSTLSASRIGSLRQSGKSAWEVAYRPLSMSMNQVVRLGTLPRSELPTTTYDKAPLYFEALAELHLSHLKHQRNNAIDSADDCRHERVAGVIDWEFTYTAPAEFTYAPPWWLLLETPEYWSKGLDDWCTKYEKWLPMFLQAIVECEEKACQNQNGRLQESQRLSSQMRRSWESGGFGIKCAAKNNFAFDATYWNKIDQRFFGFNKSDDNICDIWKKRRDLLEPEETEIMEKYVNLKLQKNETRVLSWDPDEYTIGYMAKMKT